MSENEIYHKYQGERKVANWPTSRIFGKSHAIYLSCQSLHSPVFLNYYFSNVIVVKQLQYYASLDIVQRRSLSGKPQIKVSGFLC